MEKLIVAEKLNEIQSHNEEEIQDDENSLSFNCTMVSELDKEDKSDESSIEISSEDEKDQRKPTNVKETSPEGNRTECISSLGKYREGNVETLENGKKIVLMEKKILEQKESSLNENLTILFEDTFKYLKAWDAQLKTREKALVTKAEKLKSLIKRAEEVYDISPVKQYTESIHENNNKSEDGSSRINELLEEIESNEMLGTATFPLVAGLTQKITSLEKEKMKFVETLNESKKEIIECKKQLKEYQLLYDKDNKMILQGKDHNMNTIHNAIYPEGLANEFSTTPDGRKLLGAGWTIAKIQRLYMKYFRAESFRKALAYQKRYLTLMVLEEQQQRNNVNVKRKASFRIGAWAVIAILRMKRLVKKYQRNLRISAKYQKKETPKKHCKKRRSSNISGSSDGETNKLYHLNASRRESYASTIQSTETSPSTRSTRSARSPRSTRSTKHESREMDNGIISIDILPNRDHVFRPDSSMDTTWRSEDIPRAYPRPSGVTIEELPSVTYGEQEDDIRTNYSTYVDAILNKASSSSPPSLLNPSSADENEAEKTNDSLSCYIHTLESLQVKLKNLGYKPSL